MSDLQAPPNYPVIVVHTDDGNGLTACTGQPMPGPVGDVYRNVPRYFCQACARVNACTRREECARCAKRGVREMADQAGIDTSKISDQGDQVDLITGKGFSDDR